MRLHTSEAGVCVNVYACTHSLRPSVCVNVYACTHSLRSSVCVNIYACTHSLRSCVYRMLVDHTHIGHEPHQQSSFLLGPYGPPYGPATATGGSPPGYSAPMGGGMFGGPMGGGMYGGPPGSMGGPQSSSWLMRNITGPSATPPAPAEAAANWANHASLANAKAQHALMDIEKIRADALGQISKFTTDADRVLAKVQTMSNSAIRELQAESQNVWKAYANGKLAVQQMFDAAAKQAKATHDLALQTTEGARKGGLMQLSKSSFAKLSGYSAEDTRDHALDGSKSADTKVDDSTSGEASTANSTYGDTVDKSTSGGPSTDDSKSVPDDTSASVGDPASNSKSRPDDTSDSVDPASNSKSVPGKTSTSVIGRIFKNSKSSSSSSEQPASTGNPDLDAVMVLIRQYV